MKDLIKAVEGEELSPVLVLSGKRGSDTADGFHRVSLVYRLDPYAAVPLRSAEPPAPRIRRSQGRWDERRHSG